MASKALWRQAIVEVWDDLAPEPGSYFQGEFAAVPKLGSN